jgi:hypothetical protein
MAKMQALATIYNQVRYGSACQVGYLTLIYVRMQKAAQITQAMKQGLSPTICTYT